MCIFRVYVNLLERKRWLFTLLIETCHQWCNQLVVKRTVNGRFVAEVEPDWFLWKLNIFPFFWSFRGLVRKWFSSSLSRNKPLLSPLDFFLNVPVSENPATLLIHMIWGILMYSPYPIIYPPLLGCWEQMSSENSTRHKYYVKRNSENSAKHIMP